MEQDKQTHTDIGVFSRTNRYREAERYIILSKTGQRAKSTEQDGQI